MQGYIQKLVSTQKQRIISANTGKGRKAIISPITFRGWLKTSMSDLYEHSASNYAPKVSIVFTVFLHTVTIKLKRLSKSFQMGCFGVNGVKIEIK